MARISCALLAICAVLASTVAASATPHRRAMSVLEQRQLPSGFARTGSSNFVPSNDPVNLRVALTPKDRDGLVKTLYAVSTPGSASYGQYLSHDEVKAFMAPEADTVSAVTKWLEENGVQDIKTTGAYGDWLSFSVPSSKANALLNANFESFLHVSSGEQIVRTLEYSVPEELLGHISLVHPTTSFALRPPAEPLFIAPSVPETNITARANPAPTSCNTNVTPACLQALYGIPTTPATTSTRLGVTGFIQQWAQEADLRSFLTLLRTDIDPSTTFTLETFDGGENPQGSGNAGIEANLDIQYTVGIATGVPVTFLSVGLDNSDGVSGFLDVYQDLAQQDSPPPVLSTSYGFDEPDLGPALATRMCDAYATLGARGVSNLYASGDGGVWGSRDPQCTTFVPTFPAGCPFVTAVGSTSAGSASGEEVASDFSSGGFSNVFARPEYQDAAVTGYLSAIGDANAGLYNATSRGYPDISARGTPVQIVSGGQRLLVQGTSCSCPIFASVVALINDRLVAAGKPVLGFLNPFLYANPDALFDVAAGTNNGPNCQSVGFDAVTGWDASTGLGTPNFDALLAAAEA